MVKKIVALLFAGFMVSSVASAELPVIVDIKPKEINKDPVVLEYASALWESFNWDSSDTTFATVVSGEGMRRIVVQVDAVTVPQAEGSKEDVQFAYGVVLAVDLEGDSPPIFLTQVVGVSKKKDLKKIAYEHATNIKDALRGMPGIMQALQSEESLMPPASK